MFAFRKVFWKNDVQLVLIDISQQALDIAQAKVEKKIERGRESGAFKSQMADTMKNSILYTTDYSNVFGSNIVLEAATEDGNF